MSLPVSITARFAPLHPRHIDLSLGRIERLLADLGAPQTRVPPVIHVAGTNGKGSTVAFMRAILEAAQKRVHVYTSPHLVRFNERIRIEGQLVDDATLETALDRCERVNAGQSISVFEITTAAAFLLFSETPADFLLLEVGLGGRYDATNVVQRPAATVITPVSIDHPEFLGTTVDKIAYEKAGILRPSAPAIIAPQQEAALRVIEREAMRVGTPLTLAHRDFFMRAENGRLIFEDGSVLLDLPLPRLAGRHQHGNAAIAIATLRSIAPELPISAFERGLKEVHWPARLQYLHSGPLIALAPPHAEVWLDGAHNEAGGRVLAEAIADFEDVSPRPFILICGMLTNKDTASFLAHFKDLAREVFAVPIFGEHAGRSASQVATIAAGIGLPTKAVDSVASAFVDLSARDWPIAPRILITGSLYLAGSVLEDNGNLPK